MFAQVSVALALALTACSNADQPATPNGGSSPQAGGVSSGTLPFSAKALCAYLKGEIPKLKAVGSEVGAHAQLAGGMATFFEQQGAKPDDAVQLEEATLAECPDVRTEVLAVTGLTSFTGL
jgi:hypothetical protein